MSNRILAAIFGLALMFFGCDNGGGGGDDNPSSSSGEAIPSSSNIEPSSSSLVPSSSSDELSSSSLVPSSSSDEPSSSSLEPSSSSVEPSSSSLIPSSSSVEPSSSSLVPSSSSIEPSSSSLVPSSSSVEPSSSSLIPSSSSVEPSSSSISYSDKGNNISSYRTVTIGTQVWMAENLDYNVIGSVCYNNDNSNCDTYGRLYDWATAMNLPSSCNDNECAGQISSKHQGICPTGWHIPSGADWQILMNFIDGTSLTSPATSTTAGKFLKATSGWNDYNEASGNGEDKFGFAALPGGYGSSTGSFIPVGIYGDWWSASEYNAYDAYYRYMYCNGEYADWSNYNKARLFSVRCVQD